MGCNSCFEDYLVKCVDEITVYGQLAPLSTYSWVIKDKAGRRFSAEFTTDSAGFWTIPIEDLPDGLLTEHSGTFSLSVQDADTCKPKTMKVAKEVDCIQFEIYAGTFLKDALGCNFQCQGSTGALSTIVNYESVNEKVIPYTAEMLANFGAAPTVQVYSLVAGETDVFEIISVPITQVYTSGVLTSITVGNLTGLEGYIIIN